MQAIRIGVVRGGKYHSTDGFHIYGDGGRGRMDWEHPVTPRRILLWEEVAGAADHLWGGHLMARHLDSLRMDGHLEGTHVLDEHLRPAATVFYETDPFVFGRFGHAVVMEDIAGNAVKDQVAEYETVINSEPASPGDFLPASYSAEYNRMNFSYTPSERLTG